MLTAPAYLHDADLNRRNSDRWFLAGFVLSLLLHAGLVWLLREQPWDTGAKLAATPMEVEIVIPPPLPPPPPAPQQRAAEPLPPPEVPQLQRGPLAEQSTVPPPKPEVQRETPRPQRRAAPAPLPITPDAPLAVPPPAPRRQEIAPRAITPEERRVAIERAPEMRQSERDFFLSQIASAWVIDRRARHFREIRISGTYIVLPDGMLAAPFNVNEPENLRLMISGWDELQRPGMENIRVATTTFVRAMRLAQPLQLPPNFGDQPKRMTLDFVVGDLP